MTTFDWVSPNDDRTNLTFTLRVVDPSHPKRFMGETKTLRLHSFVLQTFSTVFRAGNGFAESSGLVPMDFESEAEQQAFEDFVAFW